MWVFGTPVIALADGRGPSSVPAVSVLHHLALGTADVARLASFYRDTLRLREVARHHSDDGTLRSIWLDLGGALLMVERTSEAPRLVSHAGAGFFLIAIAVARAERERCELELQAAGCTIEARSEWTSYSRDPDGNRIAISCYPLNLPHAH